MAKQKKLSYPFLFFALILFFLFWLVRPAILGQLGGTFRTREVPSEYVIFKNFITSQQDFFRTFWIPKKQRFGVLTNDHPGVNAERFFVEDNCQEPFCSLAKKMPEEWGQNCLPRERCYVRELAYFLNPKTAEVLSQMAVKYVVVPFDSEGEIFLAEWKYNPQQRKEVEDFLDSIAWLKKVDVTDKIAVYETPSHQSHFFLDDSGKNELVNWEMINPTKYLVSLKVNQPPAKMVFSETYDQLWQAKIGQKIIPSEKTDNMLNSFRINESGDLEIVVEFAAQKYVYWGAIVSGFTLLILVVYFIKLGKINFFF